MTTIKIDKKNPMYTRLESLQNVANRRNPSYQRQPNVLFRQEGYLASTNGMSILAVKIDDIADEELRKFIDDNMFFSFDKGYLTTADFATIPSIKRFIPIDWDNDIHEVMHFKDNKDCLCTDMAVTAMRFSGTWLNGSLLKDVKNVADEFTKYKCNGGNNPAVFMDENNGMFYILMGMNYDK